MPIHLNFDPRYLFGSVTQRWTAVTKILVVRCTDREMERDDRIEIEMIG